MAKSNTEATSSLVRTVNTCDLNNLWIALAKLDPRSKQAVAAIKEGLTRIKDGLDLLENAIGDQDQSQTPVLIEPRHVPATKKRARSKSVNHKEPETPPKDNEKEPLLEFTDDETSQSKEPPEKRSKLSLAKARSNLKRSDANVITTKPNLGNSTGVYLDDSELLASDPTNLDEDVLDSLSSTNY